jgi:chaperonin GroES
MEEIIKPSNGYVIIQPKKQEKVSVGGIVLPDSHNDKPQEGIVIAVGGQVNENKPPCKKGDYVIYNQYNGMEYKEYLILRFESIMAIKL